MNPAKIEVFQYSLGADGNFPPAWQGWEETPPAAAPSDVESPVDHQRAAAEAAALAELERRLAEEGRRAHAAGREQGRQEGRLAEREAQAQAAAEATQQRMRQTIDLMDGFIRERDSFLVRVEREVVELALAVAARILRREAQMDPLLLTGAVRVALGQLSSSTVVTLRVPPAELDLWIESIALIPNLALKPTVRSGEGMRLGDCAIETDLGTVDLGIRSQLGEIERGFFDRAGSHRVSTAPPPRSGPPNSPAVLTMPDEERGS